MNRDNTTTVTPERRLSMPLALLISLLTVTAVGYATWTSTRDEVARQGKAIVDLQNDARTTREILIRVDENVSILRRNERRASGTLTYPSQP